MRRSLTIVGHELRILRHDPLPAVILVVMPVALMAFVRPALEVVLESQGYEGANGAEQVVPGMTVMFAFFFVAWVGFSFFREHGWGMWDRIRAAPVHSAEIVVGKLLPVYVLALAQQCLLFAIGVALLDLEIPGSLVAIVLVGSALAACLVALGLALAAVARTVQQVDAITNVGALVLGGLGGALTPIGVLPGWAQAVAPATPTYWAMRGFRSVILDGGGVSEVLLPVGVLAAFTLGFGVVGLLRLRLEEVKISVA